MSATRQAVVIGDTEVARRTCASLSEAGWQVHHLLEPTDAELSAALSAQVCAVAVLIRGDVTALRYALLVEHLLPRVRLVITVFDRTVADQLVRVVPNCQVTSPADSAVPSIIAACLGDDIVSVEQGDSGPVLVVDDGDGVTSVLAWQRPHGRMWWLWNGITGQVRAHDVTTRILITGLLGLLLTLVTDWVLSAVVLHEGGLRAFYIATRVVATVGPGDAEQTAPSWYLLFSGFCMLATIGFTALFTAGVVNRLLSARSVGIVGVRTLPTRDHVVVVGLGQVGLRLSVRLRQLGVPVVVVERDPRANNLRLAKRAGVPVLIAHAEDRATLERLNLRRARALAAMGADDLDNVEVAIAARAVAPGARIVLRAGDDDVIAETRSLFRIGQVRDVSALTARAVTAYLAAETALQQGAKPATGRATSDNRAGNALPRRRCACAMSPELVDLA